MRIILSASLIVLSIHFSCNHVNGTKGLETLKLFSGKDLTSPIITLFNRTSPRGLTVPLMTSGKNPLVQSLHSSLSKYSYTFVTVHGFETGSENVWAHELKNNILKSMNANVLIVDWSNRDGHKTNNSIDEEVDKAYEVAKLIAKFFNMGGFERVSLNYDRMYFIGHSMGARIADFALQRMNKKAANLVGLDPNEISWSKDCSLISQQVSDIFSFRNAMTLTSAEYITVVHSDCRNLGYRSKVGKTDIFLNDCNTQPGCEDEVGSSKKTNCNHEFAAKFFKSIAMHEFPAADESDREALQRNFAQEIDKCFPMSYMCEDHESFAAGRCNSCEFDNVGPLRSRCFHVGLPLPQKNYKEFETMGQLHTLKTDANGDCLYTYRVVVGIQRRSRITQMDSLDDRIFIRIGLSNRENHSKTIELSFRNNLGLKQKYYNSLLYQQLVRFSHKLNLPYFENEDQWLKLQDIDFRSVLVTFGSSIHSTKNYIGSPLRDIPYLDVWGKNVVEAKFIAVQYMSHPSSVVRNSRSFLLTQSNLVNEQKDQKLQSFDYFATFSSSA